MKPQHPPEAELAWLIYNKLEELSSLLWESYDHDFVSFAMEENHQQWLSTLSDTQSIDDSSPNRSSGTEP